MNECHVFTDINDMIRNTFKSSFDYFFAEYGDYAESYQFARMSVMIVTKSFEVYKNQPSQ